MRQRVEAVRERQRKRFEGIEGVTCNADMAGTDHRRPAEVRKFCGLDDTCRFASFMLSDFVLEQAEIIFMRRSPQAD